MRKLILVDDEPLFLKYLNNNVDWKKYGFVVAGTFSSGPDVLTYLSRHTVDSMITDIKMPLMDGSDLIRHALEIQKDLYIVALSGYDDFPLVKGAFINGAKDYMLKIDVNTENFEKMMQRMLKHLSVTVADEQPCHSMKENDSRLIDMIKKYIRQHYCENLQLSDLSERFNFSVGYLSALFSRETGMTFKEYITMLRIEKAKQELINSNKCIYEICEQVGYNNLEHFSRIFKKIVRCSPSVYRQRYGEAKSCS